MDAYILINSMPSQEKNIIEDLNKIPEVIEVDGILGKYDIIVKISSDLPNDIDLAVGKIRSIKGITSSDTMPVIYGQGGSIDNEINQS
ncbi:MAG: Lrp/AsnC ligand binding domain-containing protein [Nitrosopumilus sp.]|nr:Lrp/AsnC ligand binding domain-containing protein [Nitrosopumilus sp.]